MWALIKTPLLRFLTLVLIEGLRERNIFPETRRSRISPISPGTLPFDDNHPTSGIGRYHPQLSQSLSVVSACICQAELHSFGNPPAFYFAADVALLVCRGSFSVALEAGAGDFFAWSRRHPQWRTLSRCLSASSFRHHCSQKETAL